MVLWLSRILQDHGIFEENVEDSIVARIRKTRMQILHLFVKFF